MIRLFAHIYTQTDYQTNYRSLPKFVPDGWSVSSVNLASLVTQLSSPQTAVCEEERCVTRLV